MSTITIKEEKVYTLTIGNEEIPGWTLDSSWQGMECYRKGSETVIVNRDNSQMGIFQSIFPGTSEPLSAEVVKASPSIIAKLKDAEEQVQ